MQYDISDPTAPQFAGRWFLSSAGSLTINWTTVINDMLLIGSQYQVCDPYKCHDKPNPLELWNISQPWNPRRVGSASPLYSYRKPFDIRGNFLYLLTAENYLDILEVRDQAVLLQVGGIDLGEFTAADVTINGSVLYLANRSETKIVNVSDPSNPVDMGIVSEVIAGTVHEEILFGFAENRIEMPYIPVIDISNPLSPTLMTTIYHPAGKWAAKSSNDLLYIVDATAYDESLNNPFPYDLYLHTVDISDPDTPQGLRTDPLGSFTDGYPTSITIVQDNYLYLTRSDLNANYGVDIYRLPTPTTPPEFIRTLEKEAVLPLLVFPNALVIQLRSGAGMEVYNLSDPSAPVLATHLALNYGPLAAEGNYGYFSNVATPTFNPVILDFSVPETPVPIANFTVETSLRQPSGAVQNRHLYFYGDEGLSVIDFTEFNHPLLETHPPLPIPFEEGSLYTEGNHLYLAATISSFSLQVYRIDTPMHPSPSASLYQNTSGPYGGSFIPHEETFYFVDNTYGLRTYDLIEAQTQFLPLLHNTSPP